MKQDIKQKRKAIIDFIKGKRSDSMMRTYSIIGGVKILLSENEIKFENDINILITANNAKDLELQHLGANMEDLE